MAAIRTPKATQLPSGSWHVQLRINGKRVSVTADTEDEAVRQALLRKITESSDSPSKSVLETMTIGDAVDNYINTRVNILSPSTIRDYRQMRKTRFQSAMSRKLTDPVNWQKVINDECKTVKPKTVRNAWGLVKPALDENNISYIAPTLPKVARKDAAFLSPAQIKVFIELIKGDRYELPYLLALHGLRASEVLALKPANIHDGRIYVRGSRVENDKNVLVYRELNKTSQSRRSVPVMIPRINELVKDVKSEWLCDYSFDGMNKHLHTVTKNNDLPPLHFHALRHSFASLCYHLGLNELECMRLGGWSDINTMRKIYTHLAEEKITDGEIKLQNFFM